MARFRVIAILAGVRFSADWPQFRGQHGSGVSPDSHLPSEFGPCKNVVWKVSVPFGYYVRTRGNLYRFAEKL